MKSKPIASVDKIELIKKWVRTQVSPKRYKHIQGVALSARKLAKQLQLSTVDAEIAAWLHDCAKELSKDEMTAWIKKSSFKLDANEKKIPALWHPHAGAAIAAEKWGVKNIGILEAIRCHTLGGPSMSRLAQAIFVADYIEPGRRFDGVEIVRKAASRSLSEAVLLKCSMTVSHLLSQNMKIHGRLLETWNHFLDIKNEE